MAESDDEKNTHNVHVSYGLLHVGLSSEKITMSYAGNMGHGMREVDWNMKALGLFPTDALRGIPSFIESGWPDYLWQASVTVADLPSELLAKVYALAVSHIGTTDSHATSDAPEQSESHLKISEGIRSKAQDCLHRYEGLKKLRNSPWATDTQVSMARGECDAKALQVILEAIVSLD